MYLVKFLQAGTEESDFNEYVMQGVQSTPFEPREGRTYIFRHDANSHKGDRFVVSTVVIEQTWDKPEAAVARVYLKKLG